MPPVEAREFQVILGRNGSCVEGAVVRVPELHVSEALIFSYEAVADHLHLRLVRNGSQVWMQNAAASVQCLAVPVPACPWIEALGKLELGFGRNVPLAFENEDLVPVQSIVDYFEIIV